MNDAQAIHSVSIARGNIYIPRATYEAYFRTIEAVALLPHADGILIYPLINDSAGGSLLKIRNSNGDRLVHAQEFLRNHDFSDDFEKESICVSWLTDKAALLVNIEV